MIEKKTYSEQALIFITRCLLEGEFEAGDKLDEVVLSKRLSISRAPIREALQTLVQEGLVTSIPQRGKFVTSLSPDEIRYSYITGGILEAAGAASCVDLYTEEDFDEMERILSLMNNARENNDLDSIAQLDTAFHAVVLSHCDNTILKEVAIRSCQKLSKILLFRRWREAFTCEEMYERHREVFDAIKTRDAAVVEATIRQHYVESGERMAEASKKQEG